MFRGFGSECPIARGKIIVGKSFEAGFLRHYCSRCSTSRSSVRLCELPHPRMLRYLAALAQNILLFFLGIPAKMAIEQPHSPLSLPDYILGALGLLTVLVEFISDNQQHSFQTFKRTGKLNANDWIGARIPWSKRDAERGFITRGLWAWSRHPNFLCEQTFWVGTSYSWSHAQLNFYVDHNQPLSPRGPRCFEFASC